MSVSIPHPPIQWVQLTYTSADSVAGGKGGWGVKEVTPGVPDSVITALVNGAQTRVDEVEETTPFASDATIQSRVRVLTHRVGDGERTTLWHTVPASRDGTGRPGNVFCHAAQRISGGAPGFRPVEMWRSPGWLVPFGAAEVNAAELDELAPGPIVTRDSVVNFLQDPAHDRRYSLEWLVAAFAHTVLSSAGGGTRATLVLLTETADEAALWLGALSYVLPVPIARAMEFTTFARGRDLLDGATAGLDVVAVPRADLALLRQSPMAHYLVCDPLWELDEPEGGSWSTPLGQRFPADQGWQDAVLDLLALETTHAVRVLYEADALSLDLSDDRLLQLPLGWTLALALLADPDSESVDRERRLAEAVAEVPEFLETTRGRRMAGFPKPEETPTSPEPQVDPRAAATPEKAALRSNVRTGPPVASRYAPPLTVGRESPMLQQVRIYLQGGWREDAAPETPLTPDLVEQARVQLASEIRTAVESGTRELDPANVRSVRRVAELLSFLYQYWLQDLVDGDLADAGSRLHDELHPLLDTASGPDHASWRAGLSPMLRAPHPDFAGRRRGSPPVSTSSLPAVEASVRLVEHPRATPGPVPSYFVPTQLCVDESALESVAGELRMAQPGDPAVGLVAEAVLTLTGGALVKRRSYDRLRGVREIAAAHWLAAHPPWTMADEGRSVLAEWARHLRGRSVPPSLRSSMDGWCAAHYAMEQAASATSSALETPDEVLGNVRESFDQCAAALAGLLLFASLDRAADVLALVASRASQRRGDSVLDVVGPGRVPVLGMAAVVAARERDPAALDEVRDCVEARPTGGLPPPLAALFDSLTHTPTSGSFLTGGR